VPTNTKIVSDGEKRNWRGLQVADERSGRSPSESCETEDPCHNAEDAADLVGGRRVCYSLGHQRSVSTSDRVMGQVSGAVLEEPPPRTPREAVA
jgi:hypothetical protein